MNKSHHIEQQATAMAHNDLRWRRVRTMLAIGPLILYALAFVPLIYLVGFTMVLQVAPPVIAALVAVVGGLLGMRAGVLAALLAFPLHILLLNLAGRAGWDIMMGIQLPESLLLMVIGAVIGRLSDLQKAIKQELTERQRAEKELQQAHETLEIRVQERTADLARANESLQDEINKRQRIQHQLEEQSEYLTSVLQHAPDAIVTADVSKRIIEWNPGAERLFGYTRNEARGKDLDDLIGRPDVDEQLRFFTERVLSGKGIPPTEVVRYRKGGTPVDVIVSGSPIMIGGQMGGFVAIYTDITERKQAEQELRRREMQLMHAERLSLLGEMATGVAHEINQPLAIISLAAESRLRDMERGRLDMSILPHEMEDILKNVRRIDRIITHMRTFARMVGEWASIEPEEVLNNAFILLGEQFRIHDISISREIEEGLPPIEVDTNQLEQVFLNILMNARQALDDKAEEAQRDGKVFNKRLACRISRERNEQHEYVVFEFADNARGVPDEMRSRVFEPFFTTKEVGKGTGLGLSIAYSIVTHSLGGEIWVEGNEMGGASFKVALPLEKTREGGRSPRIEDRPLIL